MAVTWQGAGVHSGILRTLARPCWPTLQASLLTVVVRVRLRLLGKRCASQAKQRHCQDGAPHGGGGAHRRGGPWWDGVHGQERGRGGDEVWLARCVSHHTSSGFETPKQLSIHVLGSLVKARQARQAQRYPCGALAPPARGASPLLSNLSCRQQNASCSRGRVALNRVCGQLWHQDCVWCRRWTGVDSDCQGEEGAIGVKGPGAGREQLMERQY